MGLGSPHKIINVSNLLRVKDAWEAVPRPRTAKRYEQELKVSDDKAGINVLNI